MTVSDPLWLYRMGYCHLIGRLKQDTTMAAYYGNYEIKKKNQNYFLTFPLLG